MGLVVEHVTKSFGEKKQNTSIKRHYVYSGKRTACYFEWSFRFRKSTLLSIIGGLLGKSSGEITLDDLDYVDLSDKINRYEIEPNRIYLSIITLNTIFKCYRSTCLCWRNGWHA